MNRSAFFLLGRVSMALPVLLFSFAAMPVYAQSADSVHVSAVDGNVDFQHGDDGTAAPATVETSLAQGDYVTTHDSRAEVQFDENVTLRLGPNTQVRFDNLDSESRVVTLGQGTVELRVVHDGVSYPEIQTPSVSVDPNRAGAYRVSVLEDGSTQITVRSGRTHVVAGKFDRVLDTGSTLAATGESDSTQFTTLDEIAADDFDSWNAARDQIADAAAPQTDVVPSQAPQMPAQPAAPPPPPPPAEPPPSYQQLPSYAVPEGALPSYAVPGYAPQSYVVVPVPVMYSPYAYARAYGSRFYPRWRYQNSSYGRRPYARGSYRGGYRR
jgi:hypothetical protein